MTRIVANVAITAPVNPTEDPQKVVQAIRQIFPDAEIEQSDDQVHATTASLDTLLRKASEERVLDAARGALWRGRKKTNMTVFEVNKQAAYVGRVNFNEVSHPLGDLEVTVEIDDLDALLDKIAPPTRAELHADKSAEFRHDIHQEETRLARMGRSVETGFEDDPDPEDVDPWEEDDGDNDPDDDPDNQPDDDPDKAPGRTTKPEEPT